MMAACMRYWVVRVDVILSPNSFTSLSINVRDKPLSAALHREYYIYACVIYVCTYMYIQYASKKVKRSTGTANSTTAVLLFRYL